MSRDPTVPVNLTTTTPVGPVERTLAATQSTDRVERLRYWRRGGSALAYYIDPSFGPGGDGSYSSPWDDFTEVNALTGDLGGRILRLKSGQTIYDGLSISSASNFTIETYGGSTKAIIDGSQLATWTWTNLSGDIWYANSGSEKAIWVGDVAFERAVENQSRPPLQSVMDRNEYTFWFGTHSSNAGAGDQLYVHAHAGMNMETERLAGRVRTTSELIPLSIFAGSNVALRSIQVQRGANFVIQCDDHGAGLTMDGVVAKWNGYGSGGQNLLDLNGASLVSPATDISITNCDFLENYAGGNNNAMEFSWVTGMTISDCIFRRILGNAVEYWKTIKDTRVTRCRFEEIGGSILWLHNETTDESGSDHDNNQIDNCIATSLGTMEDDYQTDQQGSALLRHQAGTNTRVYHNTLVSNNTPVIEFSEGTHANNKNTITVKNNVFLTLQSYALRARFLQAAVPGTAWTFVSSFTGAKNEIISNNNNLFSRYYTDQTTTRVGYFRTAWQVGLSGWQAQGAYGTPDLSSTEADPLLTAAFGVSAASTTMAAGGTAGTWTMTVTSAAGMSVGGFVAIPMATSPRLHFTRIMAIAGNVLTGELKIGGGGISNGAAVTYYAEIQTDATPQTGSPLLNAGVGSTTDPLIPTTDFFGNPRSTTTPDIGAVEA